MGLFKIGSLVWIRALGLYTNITYGGILNVDIENEIICFCQHIYCRDISGKASENWACEWMRRLDCAGKRFYEIIIFQKEFLTKRVRWYSVCGWYIQTIKMYGLWHPSKYCAIPIYTKHMQIHQIIHIHPLTLSGAYYSLYLFFVNLYFLYVSFSTSTLYIVLVN